MHHIKVKLVIRQKIMQTIINFKFVNDNKKANILRDDALSA